MSQRREANSSKNDEIRADAETASLFSADEVAGWCPHLLEPEGCIHCSPKYAGTDVRDGFCPTCNRGVEPPVASTWHVVNDDGTSECAACGHVHPYLPGHLEKHRAM